MHADCHLCQLCNRYQGWICATKSSAMATGCLFLVMLAFLLSICTFLTWQNCCKGRYQWKKTLQPDTAIAELRFSKIRVTIVRQLSKTGWSHLLPLWDDPAPGWPTIQRIHNIEMLVHWYFSLNVPVSVQSYYQITRRILVLLYGEFCEICHVKLFWMQHL